MAHRTPEHAAAVVAAARDITARSAIVDLQHGQNDLPRPVARQGIQAVPKAISAIKALW
jgi:hypothetical protein